MKKLTNRAFHYFLGGIALLFLPCFWFVFACLGSHISFKQFFKEWYEQVKSEEPWGIFDGGLDE